MFSIIVVSLNTKKKFKNTIESILKQTLKDYQIVVVDGKSNDGTLRLINRYKKHIYKILIKEDKGIYYAMNSGIKLASKKWIIFLNSGDTFYSIHTLKKIKKYLNKYSKIDVLVGNTKIINKNLAYKKNYKKLSKESLTSCFSHQSTVIRNSLQKKNYYNTKYKIASDFNFFKSILNKNGKFHYINETLSINEADGISDKNRFLALNEFKKINKYQKNIKFLYLKYFYLKIYYSIIFITKYLMPKFFQKKILQIKHNL
tara:strand:+ start:1021 stop:1794 length:774 start_codon:yes stop_codon:yes gene_type:complete